jgi:5-methylthioadenosine/S-adenosylhomocysteine deaminase
VTAPPPVTLIRGARLVDARRELSGDLLIEGGRIAALGAVPAALAATATQVIDGRGRAVIPGFVNTHTHAAMVLFRGYTDDVPLRQWLEQKIWPLERHLAAEHVHAGTRLACLEMLTSGTTCFHDMYFQPEAVARAVAETGMRAVISRVFFDMFESRPVEALVADVAETIARLRGFANVAPSVGPHAAYTVSLEGLAAAYRLAEREDVLVHFHLAETARELSEFRDKHGRDLFEALDAVGLLGPRLVAAHGIWLDEAAAARLAARGVTVAHCPASNMKLGSGWSPQGARALPYPMLQRAGVRVALGTDGAAANNNLDMFETMKLAALLQKHATGDPAVLTAHEAFAMATARGAEALRLPAGLLEPGHHADLVVVDLDRPYLCPGHDLVADLVYAGRPDCVETVIVAGTVVLRDRRHPQQAEILTRAREAAADLLARARAASAAAS